MGPLAWLVLTLVAGPALAESPDTSSAWHYGAYLDLAYAVDFNFPENHKWRSKTTTPRVNEFTPNMVMGYVRKDVSPDARWGMEFGVMGGSDTDGFVPAPIPGRRAPVGSADALRHFSRTNVSYLAPVGNGLTLTAGLMNSYIGYESLFARDNPTYTRAYMSDNSPYLVFGVAATYPVSDRLSLGLYVINGYVYLNRINDQPRYGTQVQWKVTERLTVTNNLFYGPEQANTTLKYWRAFTNNIVEWRTDRLALGAAYDFGTEKAANLPTSPQVFWTTGALFGRWHVAGPWSVTLRPEFYWDRYGWITGAEQFIRAITTTLEYRLAVARQTAVMRLEYRYDESTGRQGGFFTQGTLSPGRPQLTTDQQLLLFSVIWSYDS